MIIGLSGYKGSGKDTAGQYLVEHYGFERRAFADKVKEATEALLGVPRPVQETWKNETEVQVAVLDFSGPYQLPRILEQVSFRHFLQRVGTEMGRNIFGEDFWIDQVLHLSTSPLRDIVISDCRFSNEVDRIRNLGGKVVRIDRPDLMPKDTHVSEQLPDCDYILINESSLEEQLYPALDELLDVLGISKNA